MKEFIFYILKTTFLTTAILFSAISYCSFASRNNIKKAFIGSPLIIGDSHAFILDREKSITSLGNGAFTQYVSSLCAPRTEENIPVLLTMWPGAMSPLIEGRIYENREPSWSIGTMGEIIHLIPSEDLTEYKSLRNNHFKLKVQLKIAKLTKTHCYKLDKPLSKEYKPNCQEFLNPEGVYQKTRVYRLAEATHKNFIQKGYFPVYIETPLHFKYRDCIPPTVYQQYHTWLDSLVASNGLRIDLSESFPANDGFLDGHHFSCEIADSVNKIIDDAILTLMN